MRYEVIRPPVPALLPLPEQIILYLTPAELPKITRVQGAGSDGANEYDPYKD